MVNCVYQVDGLTEGLMHQDEFIKYEMDCIREAAGKPKAQVYPVDCPGGLRSRTYILESGNGSSFVKCLDSGYLNAPAFMVTLNHEAEDFLWIEIEKALALDLDPYTRTTLEYYLKTTQDT